MKFILTGRSGKKATLVVNSVGGGIIETVWVNGYRFSGKGDSYVLFVEDPQKQYDSAKIMHDISELQPVIETGISEGLEDGIAYWAKLSEYPCESVLDYISKYKYFLLKPILPVTAVIDKKPQLFNTMSEWVRLANEKNKSLSEIAIDYEMGSSGWTREKVIEHMADTIAKTMHRRVFAPLNEPDLEIDPEPDTCFPHKIWHEHMDNTKLLSGAISKAILYVNAVLPAYHRVFSVPGPMGAGGGMIYSVLHAVKEELHLDDSDVLRGLFVAAGVGAISASRSTTNGTTMGCAGECGCCGAMAAAGVVEMLHGTPEQAETAASAFMQITVGWPCDKISGAKFVPCLSRVLTMAAMSIVFAEWALSREDAVLPFHEVLDTAYQIGINMDPTLRATKTGGLCATPTGMKCKAAYNAWKEAHTN